MQPSKELIDHIIEMIKAKVLTAKTKAKTAVEPPQLIQNINNVTDVRLLHLPKYRDLGHLIRNAD